MTAESCTYCGKPMAEHCDRCPPGWHCHGLKGHDGPCAAAPAYAVAKNCPMCSESLEHHMDGLACCPCGGRVYMSRDMWMHPIITCEACGLRASYRAADAFNTAERWNNRVPTAAERELAELRQAVRRLMGIGRCTDANPFGIYDAAEGLRELEIVEKLLDGLPAN